jgi:neutral ceramidase
MSSGPEPPFFKQLIIPFILNIVDKAPIGTNFGDVLQSTKLEYRVVRLIEIS